MRTQRNGMRKPASIPRGAVVLVPFPFTDLSVAKVRPAIVISAGNDVHNDVIAVFISSVFPRRSAQGDLAVTEQSNLSAMGLKVPSIIKCRKIATLDRAIIIGELGQTPVQLFRKITKSLRVILALK